MCRPEKKALRECHGQIIARNKTQWRGQKGGNTDLSNLYTPQHIRMYKVFAKEEPVDLSAKLDDVAGTFAAAKTYLAKEGIEVFSQCTSKAIMEDCQFLMR